MQDTVISDPEECRADALESVKGWSSEITDAIRCTPAERITRSRIADRFCLLPCSLCTSLYATHRDCWSHLLGAWLIGIEQDGKHALQGSLQVSEADRGWQDVFWCAVTILFK